MNIEQTLSGSAAKLLLHLLRIGPGGRETPALMRGAGIGDRKAFYAAKAQLQEVGLWENPSWCGQTPQVVGEKPTGVWEMPPVLRGNPTDDGWKPDTSVGAIPPASGVNPPIRIWDGYADPSTRSAIPFHPERAGHGVVVQGGMQRGPDGAEFPVVVPTEARNFSPVLEKTARDSCIEADALPGDGEYQSPYSNYSKRRTAQVKALCMAHHELFAKDLTAYQAKQLLKASRDNAEDAYDALELAKSRNIEYPAAYAVKALERQPKPEVDHSGELDEWTPEWEAKVRASEDKLRAAGAPAYWFGEDDD